MTLKLKSTPLQKIMMLALAIALVFAISLPVAAADYFTTTDASYIQGTAPTYSAPINVTLEIQSRTIDGDYIQRSIPVTLTPSGTQSFYVRDALLAVQSGPNDLTFLDANGNPLSSGSSYFSAIVDEVTEITYGPTDPYAWDGWVFRIDGQFPLEAAGWGASIASAYLTDGDVISTYHDDISGPDVNADFAKIRSVNKSGRTVTVNVRASEQYYDTAPPYAWTLTNFANYKGATVNVYDGDTGNLVGTGTTNTKGNARVRLSRADANADSYTVEVARATYDNGLIKTTFDRVVYVP